MSHRELRNLTEMLRALGYPHLVSMQSFKTPNFELVADVLHWLVERYDSSISIDDNIETEADRVHFLKATAAAMMLKGRIKLNLKNLYSANGFAVKELLKVAAVLHDAHRGAGDGDAINDASDELVAADAVSSAKFADLKTTRALAADIVRHGAKLHELLALHPENRELHSQALSRSFEVSDVQRRLAQQAEGMAAQVEEMDKMLANVTRDEAALRAKIDKRKAELERHEKRLSSLAAVRPAFLDEYERLERTLTAQYDAYLSNWRNLQFLEGELDAVHAAEQEGLEAHERQMRAMQKQLREEELRLLRGQADVRAHPAAPRMPPPSARRGREVRTGREAAQHRPPPRLRMPLPPALPPARPPPALLPRRSTSRRSTRRCSSRPPARPRRARAARAATARREEGSDRAAPNGRAAPGCAGAARQTGAAARRASGTAGRARSSDR